MTGTAEKQSALFLDSTLSVYLDAVRCLAAFAVLYGHFVQDGLAATPGALGQWAHEAVVFFFVLSGLVIAHSTGDGARGWRHYLSARATRIYSVVVPAFVLGVLVQWIVLQWPSGVSPADSGKTGAELAAAVAPENLFGVLLFLGQSWGLPGHLPWNPPFWSLCYEVWYYVAFGLWVFRPVGRYWLLLVLLLAGPAIVVMAPIWLCGVVLARYGARWIPSPSLGALLCVGSIALMYWLKSSGVDVAIRDAQYATVPGYWMLSNSNRFVTDYLWAILISLNFLGIRAVAPWVSSSWWGLRGAIVLAASYTFSLYLYHRPMTLLAAHYFPSGQITPGNSMLLLCAVTAACVFLGHFTERRKEGWARLFSRFGI
jgi:hypothetical protein